MIPISQEAAKGSASPQVSGIVGKFPSINITQWSGSTEPLEDAAATQVAIAKRFDILLG